MAVNEHWIVKESKLTPREQRDWFPTALSAKDSARTRAAQEPGTTFLVYRLVKAIVAPPAAVEETDPTVTP